MARTSGPGCPVRPSPASPGPRSTYPGERSVCPESGPGSIARFGRRIAALCVDWLIAYGLAALAMTFGLIVASTTLSTAVLVVWLVLGVVSVRLFGFTPGNWRSG